MTGIYALKLLQRRICVCGPSKLKLHYTENLPSPLFAKEGNYSSLRQREVRRDFIDQCVIILRLLITLGLLS
jgi:hypothetical protein